MIDEPMAEFTRRQIRSVTQAALAKADVAGIVPTPLEALSRVCGIVETIDISALPSDTIAKRPFALKRILGAVFYRERLVFVDRAQGDARARFTHAHELSHKLLPWHEALYRLDDYERLFGAVKKRLDAEADAGAADLLFQGDVFGRRALEYKVSMSAPIALAADFGTSYHAAIRYYVEHHPDAVALVVAGRYRRTNGKVPIFGTFESPSFRLQFGSIAKLVGGDALEAIAERHDPIGELVAAAFSNADVVSAEVDLASLGGGSHPVVAEAFYNQHSMFVMFADARAARRLGRRVRVAVR